MTKEEILEGNTLIKNFMKVDEFQYDSWKSDQLTEGKYHSSWDWLMPIMEKIELLGFATEISYYHTISNYGCQLTTIDYKDNQLLPYEEADHELVHVLTDNKIESTYKSVVEFIKWHNKNNNNEYTK